MSTAPNPIVDAAAQKKAAYDAEKQIRLFHVNSGAGGLQHDDYSLPKGGSVIVPESIAKIWLTHTAYGNPVCEEIAPATPTAPNVELAAVKAENAEIREANDALRTRLDNLEKMLSEARAQAEKPAVIDIANLPGSTPSPEEIAQAKADAKPAKPAASKKP